MKSSVAVYIADFDKLEEYSFATDFCNDKYIVDLNTYDFSFKNSPRVNSDRRRVFFFGSTLLV